jgi:predicted Ser/Thr protein kinase
MENVSVPGYQVQGVLGRGGMGVVYRARQISLDRTVALKMILAGPHACLEDRLRFRREAEAVAQLQHAHIVQVYEVGEYDGRPYFSLEFVDGGSLSERLKGAPWSARRAVALVETLARAMEAAHRRGIIHRDLKPGNILLTSDGMPKIADFGLAKRFDHDSGQTHSGAITGTPSYMAPEQAGGRSKDIGPTTDVYALGAILYELLTGRPPFRAETPLDTVLQVLERDPPPPRLLNPHVDRDLEQICLKCLEKDPRHRYNTAQALADDLHRCLEGEVVSVSTSGLIDRLARTLEHSQYDVEFRSWGTMLILFALIMLVEHVVIFACTRDGPPYPRRLIDTARALQFGLMGIIFWRLRRHSLWPTSAAERQLWAIWIGYLLAGLILSVVNRELAAGRTLDELELYPARAVLSGLAFFAMGGIYWGRCYTFGLAFFGLAAVMPLERTWAPLGFGLLWSATLLGIGLRLRRLAREAERSSVPG